MAENTLHPEAQGPFGRFIVHDSVGLGRLIASWALWAFVKAGPNGQFDTSDCGTAKHGIEPRQPPRSLKELKEQIGGLADVPSRIKGVQVIQANHETFVLRLPPAKMIRNTLIELSDKDGKGDYPAPAFYVSLGLDLSQINTPAKKFNFFLSRVGDYTVAVCK